ncbi:MAG: hypothetical protein NC305_02430 [Lachnospiraceae bacterium]|nr:hypothetical protein [Lachnospiraceae bacterium]
MPLMILATANLWNGVAVNDPLAGTVCHVFCMLFVGFLEEIIFRGFLFKAMEKNNVRSAINTLNTFANETGSSAGKQLVHILIMIVITVAYTFILMRTLPKK